MGTATFRKAAWIAAAAAAGALGGMLASGSVSLAAPRIIASTPQKGAFAYIKREQGRIKDGALIYFVSDVDAVCALIVRKPIERITEEGMTADDIAHMSCWHQKYF